MSIALQALRARAAGPVFNGFPETLVCPIASGTATWTTAEQHELVTSHIAANKPPVEKQASNTGSGRCLKLDLPYYIVEINKGASAMAFAYDKEKNVYEFCLATTTDLNGDGYNDQCST
ncbi:hypothetical protein BUE80_DR009526 [Diplocarpon rosae]|nr:hypothetical protein BUE80_DR009526 [Diplocarpon rosae]